MEGDVITLQDLFLFDYSAGVDEEGKFLGNLKSTGLRPRFLDKLQERGVTLPPDVFAPVPREVARRDRGVRLRVVDLAPDRPRRRLRRRVPLRRRCCSAGASAPAGRRRSPGGSARTSPGGAEAARGARRGSPTALARPASGSPSRRGSTPSLDERLEQAGVPLLRGRVRRDRRADRARRRGRGGDAVSATSIFVLLIAAFAA